MKMYYDILHIVAIKPFIHGSVNELLAAIAKIKPITNLGNSI